MSFVEFAKEEQYNIIDNDNARRLKETKNGNDFLINLGK